MRRATQQIACILALIPVVAIGGACTKASKQDKRCETQIAEFRRWLRALAREGGTDWVVWNMKASVLLAKDAKADRPSVGPIIEISGGKVTVHLSVIPIRRLMASDDVSWKPTFRAALTDRLHHRGRLQTTTVMMNISGEVPWRVVRKVVTASRAAGVRSVVFLFRKPTALAPPPPSKVDAQIARLQRELDDGTWTLAPPKEPVPFDRVYRACTHTWKAAKLAADQREPEKWFTIADAAAQCGCNLDIAAAKAVHWWISGRLTRRGEVPVGARISLAAPPGRPPTPIVAPDLAPWAQTHTKVLAAAAAGGHYMLGPEQR